MSHLARNVHLALVNNPVTAATTTVIGTYVDMQNYEGAMFLATIGAATTGATFRVTYAASTTATGTAVSGASVSFAGASDDNKGMAIDVYKPHSLGRYLRPELVHVAGAGVQDFSGFLAMRYGPREMPVGASTGLVDGNIDLVVVQTT